MYIGVAVLLIAGMLTISGVLSDAFWEIPVLTFGTVGLALFVTMAGAHHAFRKVARGLLPFDSTEWNRYVLRSYDRYVVVLVAMAGALAVKDAVVTFVVLGFAIWYYKRRVNVQLVPGRVVDRDGSRWVDLEVNPNFAMALQSGAQSVAPATVEGTSQAMAPIPTLSALTNEEARKPKLHPQIFIAVHVLVAAVVLGIVWLLPAQAMPWLNQHSFDEIVAFAGIAMLYVLLLIRLGYTLGPDGDLSFGDRKLQIAFFILVATAAGTIASFTLRASQYQSQVNIQHVNNCTHVVYGGGQFHYVC